MDIMRPRHAPLQLLELFFTHTVASNCCQPCEWCEKQTLELSILSLLSLLSPSFFSSSICTDCHYENLKPLKKIMISSCGKGHGKLTGTGEDKTSAFNKRFYDPQKLVFALQQSHLPPAAGVHLGNKVQTTVLCSIHFLDQWLLKGHGQSAETWKPMGKSIQVYTLALLHFLPQTMNP